MSRTFKDQKNKKQNNEYWRNRAAKQKLVPQEENYSEEMENN